MSGNTTGNLSTNINNTKIYLGWSLDGPSRLLLQEFLVSFLDP